MAREPRYPVGSAGWLRQQAALNERDPLARATTRRAQYILSGGSARGLPLSHRIWYREFWGNPRVLLMKGGGVPRGRFPGVEEAENHFMRNANLANSDAWLMQVDSTGTVDMYIAEDTQSA